MARETKRLPAHRRMYLPVELVDAIERLGGRLSDGCEMFLSVFLPKQSPRLIYTNRLGGGFDFLDTDEHYYASNALRCAIGRREAAGPRSNLHGSDPRVVDALRGFESVVRSLVPDGLVCRCTIVSPSSRDAVYHSDQGVLKEVVLPGEDEGPQMDKYLLDRFPSSER